MSSTKPYTPAFCVVLSEPIDHDVRALGVFSRETKNLLIEQWSPIHNEHTGKPYFMALVTFDVDREKLTKLLDVRDDASLDTLRQAMVAAGQQHPKSLMQHIETSATDSWDDEIYSDLPFEDWPPSAESRFKVELVSYTANTYKFKVPA